MAEALQVDGIHKLYRKGDTPALENFSLSVGDGEIVALVGESGSGKSTLLRVIAGLVEPERGTIRIGGATVLSVGSRSLRPEERGVGLVFQDFALFPHMTVRKNLLYGLHRMPRRERNGRVAELVELAGLQGLERRYPHELSGGQQQRVALGRALAPRPTLILLDEPFSSLDPMRREYLRDEVRKIVKSAGTAAVVVTHDSRDALAIADRVAVMKCGRLQQFASPESVFSNPVDEYTATLFGKVNRIPQRMLHTSAGNGENQPPLLLRPSELKICSSTPGPGKIVGEVIATEFRGEYQEIVVEPDIPPGHPEALPALTVCVRVPSSFSIGEKVGVALSTPVPEANT